MEGQSTSTDAVTQFLQKPKDSYESFFDNCADRMRQLPKKLIPKLQFDISKLFYEAETVALERGSSAGLATATPVISTNDPNVVAISAVGPV